MASNTVRVKGLRELQRDFKKLDKSLAKEVQGELREAGDIVKNEAKSLLSSVEPGSPRSVSGLKTVVRQKNVAVQQSRRRTTGKRPDWARYQAVKVLKPALEEKSDQVVDRLDKMLGRLAGENGF